jgi:hypothetical protein
MDKPKGQDGSVFRRFARLLISRRSPKRFTFWWSGGSPYFFVACATPAETRRLKEKTDIWFVSLLNAPI